MKCQICENQDGNKEFSIREMMFGLREEFIYFECSSCGCLQIAEVPADMAKYYPSNYVSYGKREQENWLKKVLKGKRNKYVLFGKGLIGKAMYLLYRDVHFNVDIMKGIEINPDTRILDVGCGDGRQLLRPLRDAGCNNLFGIDPYIGADIINGRLKIFKKTIEELPENKQFDVIVFSHSLEHIWHQAESLLKAGRLLASQGTCLVRIPLKTEYIWNRYATNWVQIDAPRHFFIHTLESFKSLSERCGFIIRDIVFDSTELQFWGSEQYIADISYLAENSYGVNPEKSIFSSEQIKLFREMAKKLNIEQRGDQASFYLIKP